MNANVLKKLRTQRGLANAAVAVRARVGTATITMIERYGYEPRPGTKQRIADALGVDVQAIWPSDEVV